MFVQIDVRVRACLDKITREQRNKTSEWTKKSSFFSSQNWIKVKKSMIFDGWLYKKDAYKNIIFTLPTKF